MYQMNVSSNTTMSAFDIFRDENGNVNPTVRQIEDESVFRFFTPPVLNNAVVTELIGYVYFSRYQIPLYVYDDGNVDFKLNRKINAVCVDTDHAGIVVGQKLLDTISERYLSFLLYAIVPRVLFPYYFTTESMCREFAVAHIGFHLYSDALAKHLQLCNVPDDEIEAAINDCARYAGRVKGDGTRLTIEFFKFEKEVKFDNESDKK